MTFYKNTKAAILVSLALVSLGIAEVSNAEYAWVRGAKIQATLADVAYGGCMVYLDREIANPDGTLSSCPSKWLSLDCNALHRTQAQANTIWTSTLVAFSLQKTANFLVNDQIKFNGYCMARRIDVFR